MDVKKAIDKIEKKVPVGKIVAFLSKYKKELLMGGAALLLAPCEIVLGVRPFGVALVSAARGTAVSAVAAACAMLSGAVGASDNPMALSYILASGAVFALRFVIGEVKNKIKADSLPDRKGIKEIYAALPEAPFTDGPFIRCIVAAAAVSVIYIARLATGFSYTALFAGIFAALMTPALTYAYSGLEETDIRTSRAYATGRTVMLFSIAVALRSVSVLGIGVSEVFSFTSALYISRYRGTGEGAVTGLVCGMALQPLYAPVYAVAALISGILWKTSPASAVVAAGITSLSWAIYAGGFPALSALLTELCVACVINVPIAKFGWFAPRSEEAQLDPEKAEAEAVIGDIQEKSAVQRMRELITSMSSVAGIFSRMSQKLRRPDPAEVKEICDEVCRRHCTECTMHGVCWDDEYVSTSSMIDEMTSQLGENGYVSAAAVPDRIARRCFNIDTMIDEMNAACARRAADISVSDTTDIFADNFQAMSQMLENYADRRAKEYKRDPETANNIRKMMADSDFHGGAVSVFGEKRRRILVSNVDVARNRLGNDDIRALFEGFVKAPLKNPEYTLCGERVSMMLESAVRIDTEMVRCSASGDEGEANGDSVTGFSNKDGYFYALISDGMGSGREAAMTSRISAAFLERMLGAGCTMKDALGMLNGFIRAGTLECSATVDLMEIDLYSGNARFVKSGAAPSFVVRDGKIFRLQSKTVPIGILRALDAEMISFDVQPGDVIVMVSDGVVQSFEDSAWLLDMLSDGKEWKEGIHAMAEKIVERAKAENERADDVTVSLVRILEAKR